MDNLITITFWTVTLFSGLLVIPLAYWLSPKNKKRIRAFYITATIYLLGQAALFIYIYGSLRYVSRDWLHALVTPIFLGILLPVIMCVLWFLTRERITTHNKSLKHGTPPVSGAH